MFTVHSCTVIILIRYKLFYPSAKTMGSGSVRERNNLPLDTTHTACLLVWQKDVHLCCFFSPLVKESRLIVFLRQNCCIFCLCTGAKKKGWFGHLVCKMWKELHSAHSWNVWHSTELFKIYPGQPLKGWITIGKKMLLPASTLAIYSIFFFLSLISQVLLNLANCTCGVFSHQNRKKYQWIWLHLKW